MGKEGSGRPCNHGKPCKVADPGVMGLKIIPFGESSLRNREIKISSTIQYLFRMRKEITINGRFQTADKYQKQHRIKDNPTTSIR